MIKDVWKLRCILLTMRHEKEQHEYPFAILNLQDWLVHFPDPNTDYESTWSYEIYEEHGINSDEIFDELNIAVYDEIFEEVIRIFPEAKKDTKWDWCYVVGFEIEEEEIDIDQLKDEYINLRIFQCKNCKESFTGDKLMESKGRCPYCGSKNWVYGYLDCEINKDNGYDCDGICVCCEYCEPEED